MTATGGTVSWTLSQNRFDATFDATFVTAAGVPIMVTNGHAHYSGDTQSQCVPD